jgi:hypothetical protein
VYNVDTIEIHWGRESECCACYNIPWIPIPVGLHLIPDFGRCYRVNADPDSSSNHIANATLLLAR